MGEKCDLSLTLATLLPCKSYSSWMRNEMDRSSSRSGKVCLSQVNNIARRSLRVQKGMLIVVDDKHILVKQQFLEEIKFLLQEEASFF